jgi:methionyl-tRNA synthetase
MLNVSLPTDGDTWIDAGKLKLDAGHSLGTTEILFTKIEDTVIEPRLPKGHAPTSAVASERLGPVKPTVTIEDFRKLDLRVARVVSCERVPKSQKLLRLEVDLGNEQRQLIAGIAHQYKPEDLVGRTIIVVANLEPAKLMGQISHGMLLAAEGEDGALSLVVLDKELQSGSVVK